MHVLCEPEVQEHELIEPSTQADVVEFDVAVADAEGVEHSHAAQQTLAFQFLLDLLLLVRGGAHLHRKLEAVGEQHGVVPVDVAEMRAYLQARGQLGHEHFAEGVAHFRIAVRAELDALQHKVAAFAVQLRDPAELAVGNRLRSVVFGVGGHPEDVDSRFQISDRDAVGERLPARPGADFEDAAFFRFAVKNEPIEFEHLVELFQTWRI